MAAILFAGSGLAIVERRVRDRRRMQYLQHLSSWQEAARRHAHEIRTPLTAARWSRRAWRQARATALSTPRRRLEERETQHPRGARSAAHASPTGFTSFAVGRRAAARKCHDLAQLLEEFCSASSRRRGRIAHRPRAATSRDLSLSCARSRHDPPGAREPLHEQRARDGATELRHRARGRSGGNVAGRRARRRPRHRRRRSARASSSPTSPRAASARGWASGWPSRRRSCSITAAIWSCCELRRGADVPPDLPAVRTQRHEQLHPARRGRRQDPRQRAARSCARRATPRRRGVVPRMRWRICETRRACARPAAARRPPAAA